ncbi:MAG: class I SAM-dependent methyltransferase [Lachnospiraceae bacterium]|nr:class I SAM-dependent methyltransferase [Lachnospiraceae bacterium]
MDVVEQKAANMNIIEHYDKLIEENNDPFRDPQILQDYMNKWDGPAFIDAMQLDKTKHVLEIGVGTGRLAKRVAPNCFKFVGIDISPKTIERARDNLRNFQNVILICSDFLKYKFEDRFDVVYSSLTMMHFEDKRQFIAKVDSVLMSGGIFCLSIDKRQEEYIEMQDRRIRIFPDTPSTVLSILAETNMLVNEQFETEFANIFVCTKFK